MALESVKLKCIRNERILFQDVSFHLKPGEALQIEGPNGSGKTSLVRLLCGIAFPDEGEVRWNDRVISEIREQYHSEVNYIGHYNGIKKELTPLENLSVTQSLVVPRKDVSLPEVLDQMNIQNLANIPVRKLSSGQRRRVALARLLLAKASVWLLDEPFTTLDENGRELVQNMLEDHTAGGGIVVIVTHEPLRLTNGNILRMNLTP